MKKILLLTTVLTLFGAGCIGTQAPAKEFVTINWIFDEFSSSICLDGGSQDIDTSLAISLNYPNNSTDHLCISVDTQSLLATQPDIGESGTVNVKLGNLNLDSEVNGRMYTIDVLAVQ